MADPGRSVLRSQRASALMLAPALLLVVISLGAVAVDLSLVHTARRSAYRSLSAAADDAAAMIDSREFQISGRVVLDAAGADRVVAAHLGLLEGDGGDEFAAPTFEVTSAEVLTDVVASTVTVTAVVEVDHILLSAVPGLGDTTTFEMTLTGRML